MQNTNLSNGHYNKIEVNDKGIRRDVFELKCITDKDTRKVILNENKLQSVYKS